MDPEAYSEWKRQRAAVSVPDDFASNMMLKLEGESPDQPQLRTDWRKRWALPIAKSLTVTAAILVAFLRLAQLFTATVAQ